MTAKAYDAIIIGAGIVGAACAAECAREGLSVAIAEAGIVGGGATAAGMGHLVVMDDSEAQFALTRYSQTLWDEISDELPREVEHDACGTIWIAADDEEMAEAKRKEKFYSDRGVRVEMLDAHSLAEAEPNLRPGLIGGLRVPGDSVIYPPSAAQFFVDQAIAKGATLILGKAVETVTTEGICLRDGTSISAGVIVNSAGSWSPTLTRGLDVKKRKGHLLITDRYPNFLRHQLVELGYLKSAHTLTAESVAFNIQPRKTGQLLIGSSRQFGVDNSDVETSILTRMLDRAVEYLPGLGKLSSLRAWTGFRAATPDKLPLIGPHVEHKRLYLATGHEGLGITTSLGTAKLLLDQIMNRRPEIPVAPYLPARMAQEADVSLECGRGEAETGRRGDIPASPRLPISASPRPHSPLTVPVVVDGVPVTMPAGSMVAAAILKSGKHAFRRSATGEPRGPLCGMGICFECRVTIDGEAHCRSCQTLCENGMDVRTDG